ncbi:protein RALF-like 33 [Cornus florida]|uniref:protein RALF-like 33 n=1 Tax=Cornus florida TaxID=4283 RepID=UPI00289C3269|nr:protein RALF-like 33 [Cornus florida]XP_059670694.1 protein RALF-like 33 [Cornus florida]
MGIELKSPYLYFSFTVVLVFLSTSTSTSIADSGEDTKNTMMISSDQCNASIGECFTDEEEFMESEVSRRILANTGKYLSYRAAGSRNPVCDSTKRFNCGKRRNEYNRCTTYDRCSRRG